MEKNKKQNEKKKTKRNKKNTFSPFYYTMNLQKT